jgi:hypothetical protein
MEIHVLFLREPGNLTLTNMIPKVLHRTIASSITLHANATHAKSMHLVARSKLEIKRLDLANHI